MSGIVTEGQGDGLYDKTGREIMVGDVLKVFHYVAALRRKRCYMYKQVVRTKPLGKSGQPYFVLSHLNMKDPEGRDGGYYEAIDGRVLTGVEIVQSCDGYFEDRPRVLANTPSGLDAEGVKDV